MNNRCLLLLLLLAALMVAGVAGMQRDECQPDCSGKNPGDAVPDPKDCTRYYLCLDDGVYLEDPFSCPDGETFVLPEGQCKANGPCMTLCPPKECQMTCDGYPSKVADPRDCSRFYVCTDEDTVVPMSCPSDKPYFDGAALVCGTDLSACCSDPCNPFCFTAGTNVPDPLDCSRYYICSDDNVPVSEGSHMCCPVGQNFNILFGRCSEGAPCTILCDEGGVDTTPAVDTSSTTSVTPTSGCLASLTCTELGYFPRCTTCQPEYFHCSAIGQPAVIEKCSGNLMFNPDPSYPYCVLPGNCPYHSPI
ncbi:uncharacterized protein [Panulirus ornatus]|uniref:uncharacterized protein isoform X1 n=1 Tax=Panulirus ornatus TaxID=150431 RepID=UPI003A86E0E2